MKGRVLIVDDDHAMCEMLEGDLRRRALEVVCCTSAEKALETLKEREFDVVLSDLRMPDMDGSALCKRIAANRPDIPVVVMTAFGSMDAAVAAIRAGAYDFVAKPVDVDILALILDRAVEHRSLRETVRMLRNDRDRATRFEELVGDSQAMTELFDQIARVADTNTSILITGESGTGKELVARALHKRSARHGRPFVPVNCSALPAPLLEGELFGHKRGAFTDAKADRKGLFLQADQGTLFLDEVGEIPLPLQPKLLRALEERRLRPVGSDADIHFDVRIIAATNRDLETAAEDGRFREDLYYRINVIQIDVPPLRMRGADILLLARHFLKHFAERLDRPVSDLTDPAAQRLLHYSWPGNVRELRNVMERSVALTQHDRIVVDDLPEKIRDYKAGDIVIGSSSPADLLSMEEVERRYILHVLDAAGGNRTLASRILGLDRKTLYRKLQRYGVDKEPSSG